MKKKTKKKVEKQLPYVLVRHYSHGVFAGYAKKITKDEVILLQARRIWYWKGAASLSQLAIDGTKCPNECNFPAPVKQVYMAAGAYGFEVLSVTTAAQISIEGVPLWEM